jgi:hypothetical protein
LQQAQQEVQNRTNAVKQAQDRVKAGEESLAKRIAKIRARKDLEREQAALKRAEAASQEAEKTLPPKQTDAAKAQKEYAAVLDAAMNALVLSHPSAQAVAAERAAIAKAIADKDAEIKQQNEALARNTAEAQTAADKARETLTAADRLVAGRQAVRGALEQSLRQRFYREVGSTQDELRRLEAALANANQQLQPKVTALNAAVAALKQAQENAAKAQKDAQAQAAAVKSAAEETAAAEKSAQVKAAGKAGFEKALAKLQAAEKRAGELNQAAKDAQQKVAAAQTALDKAAAEKNAAEQPVNQHRQAVEAVPAKLTGAKAAAYGGLKPLPDSAWDYAKARHLLVRAGFGGTPDEVARLHQMGLHRAVSHFVDFTRQPQAEIEFAAYPRERPEDHERALSGEEQRRLQEARVGKDRQQIQNMRAWWLRRMIESPRPLEEKLALFWHDQIPSQYSDVGDSYYMYLQNELFRSHAAGNFAALLYGIAHDPAMLKYLNNDTNVKGRANENLAREIMELFSMGRDQGYTEIDIRQGARALTGFTYDSWTGQFRFISERHDAEPKTIFGRQGNWNGDDFVRLILETPYPAKFIAKQMFIFFAHDNPSIDTIEALANVLRVNNYELSPMLENLFLSEEFYSDRARGTQVKGPVQLVVGLHRDLGLKNPDYGYLTFRRCARWVKICSSRPASLGGRTGGTGSPPAVLLPATTLWRKSWREDPATARPASMSSAPCWPAKSSKATPKLSTTWLIVV